MSVTGPHNHGGGRWIRIPLIGDAEGIVLLLPDSPLTPENWEHFKNVLGALRPGLVDDFGEVDRDRTAKAASE